MKYPKITITIQIEPEDDAEPIEVEESISPKTIKEDTYDIDEDMELLERMRRRSLS